MHRVDINPQADYSPGHPGFSPRLPDVESGFLDLILQIIQAGIKALDRLEPFVQLFLSSRWLFGYHNLQFQ